METATADQSTRGRPREQRVDAAITDAAHALLNEVGYAGLTMEAVAARAKVGKATLYRRFGSKAELVFAKTVHASALPAIDTGSLRGDLALLGERIVADLMPPTTRAALPGLLADLARDSQLREHFHRTFIASERALIADLLERAHDRGELAAAADADLVHALLLGSIFASIFLLDLPVTAELGNQLAAWTATAVERPRQ
jgi:AcrR family transcriptional regulator